MPVGDRLYKGATSAHRLTTNNSYQTVQHPWVAQPAMPWTYHMEKQTEIITMLYLLHGTHQL